MLSLSKKDITGCYEGNAEVVAGIFKGNAEAVDDEFIRIIKEGEIKTLIDCAKEDDKPEYSTSFKDTRGFNRYCWLFGKGLKNRLLLDEFATFFILLTCLRFIEFNLLIVHSLAAFQGIINGKARQSADQADNKPQQEGLLDSPLAVGPRRNDYIDDLSELWQNKDQSRPLAHPRRHHIPLNHVEYLRPDVLEDSARHHESVVVVLMFCAEESHEQLPEAQSDCCKQQEDGEVFLVEEADGDDEENGDDTGDGVEQIELGDADGVDLFERLLHGLGLVENEVVSKHHEDQQDSQNELSHRAHL
jgi:hypothetical protein